MGNRSNTMVSHSFFPLIAVTVIYFVLQGLLGFFVSRIGVGFDPKRRKAADILREVRIRPETPD